MYIRKQRGVIGVISATLLMSVSISILAVYYQVREEMRIDGLAGQAAADLRELNFALMKYLSENGTSVTPGTYAGSGWLQGSFCGGSAAREYLTNCNFRDVNPFGNTYSTTVSVTGGVATGVITLDFPTYKGEVNPVLGADIRHKAAASLSGSTPVSQTFSDYDLDRTNLRIVVTTSTAPSTDIWYRADGSNQMNADANIGANALYNVSAIYGGGSASEDINTTISVGSAINVAGVMTLDSGSVNGTANSAHIEINSFDDNGHSLIAAGGLSTAFVDSFGRIIVGDGSGGSGANASIEFNQGSLATNPILESTADGDLKLTNGTNNATFLADRIYTESVNRFSDQALYNLTVIGNGGSVPIPSCRAGLTPQLFTFIQGLATNPARPISAFDIVPVVSGSNWIVNIIMKTDGPGTVPSSIIEARIVAAAKCS